MNVFLICAIGAYVLWAAVPACLAHARGRNLWLFLGLGLVITPLIATVILLCLPVVEKKEETEEAAAPTEETTQMTQNSLQPVEEVVEEPAPEEKKSALPVILSVAACGVMAAAVTVCLIFGLKGCGEPEDPMAPIFDPNGQYGQNDVTFLNDYTVTTASPTDENMRNVIAIDKDGNPALTNGQLQVGFWIDFYNFMSTYGQYASYFGLDASTPLNRQTAMTGDMTWEQYFLDNAVTTLSQNYALAQAAYAEGYVPSEEDQANIDDAADPEIALRKAAEEGGYETLEAYLQAEFQVSTMEEYMTNRYGYATMEEYLQENFGAGISVANYVDYVTTFLAASNHYQAYNEKLTGETTDDMVSAYYDDHAEEFAADRVLKVNNVSVRHILIQPEGEQDATTGEYSEEAWAAAEEKANEVYALWQEDPTEENFIALVEEYSTDGGSNTNGGLYENFDTNDMVEEFSDWSFDQSRVYGDTGIVKTSYGYHIMYFMEQTELQGWLEIAKEQMIQEQMMEHLDALCEQYPLSFDFSKIKIYDLITHAVQGMAETTATEESQAVE